MQRVRTVQAPPRALSALAFLSPQDIYQSVKQAGDSQYGVPTQCFVAQKAGVGRSSPPAKGRMQCEWALKGVVGVVCSRPQRLSLASSSVHLVFRGPGLLGCLQPSLT